MEARTRRRITRIMGVGPIVVGALFFIGMSLEGTYVVLGLSVPRTWVAVPGGVLAVLVAWRYTDPKYGENRRVARELSYANMDRRRRS